ncbi:MAG: UDP-N-acetylglucosamine--LPS N-acetylglucosamine transferase [Spirochaetia bacterium]|nr:UDP-N-acetylglucosamine--LPS N-acetylglucosamine transferase [Spirochaetia bacterium]
MKVSFIHVDAGKGHYVPAKALYDHYLEMGNEATLENLFLMLNAKTWNKLIKNWWRANLHHPKAERFLDERLDNPFIENRIKFFAENMDIYVERFIQWYNREKPDYIICTNFLANPILTTIISRSKIDIPLFVYVADVFDNPKIGTSNEVDKFFVASQLGKENCIKNGIDSDRVVVTPFPLKHEVMKYGNITQREARVELGLKQDKFTIILNFGGEGIGNVKLIEEMRKQKLDWQILVLGNLSKTTTLRYKELRLKYPKLDLITPGFVDNIGLYIKACDVQLGKTGANSLLESLYLKTPFLMSELLYTSRAFIDFMKIKKIGWAENDIKKQIEILKKYATDPEFRKPVIEDLNSLPIEFGCIPLLEIADNEYKKYREKKNK